jgi:RND family efflux transporter MFP subunit
MIGLSLAAALLVVVGCGAGEGSNGAAAAQTATGDNGGVPQRVVNVEVQVASPESYAERIAVTGEVQAERDVMVTAEESGVIRRIMVEKGERLAAGQAIAKIDDRLLSAQHDQAVAEMQLARETYERQRRLWEQDSIGSELAYLRAKYGAETAEANARVLATRLERTEIRAPIAGVLDARLIELGSTVSAGAPVARVIDAEPLKVLAGVPERYAGTVRPGAAVSIAFDNGSTVDSRASFVGTAIDSESRTFPVEVLVPNPGGRLKPGMVANLRIASGTASPSILVPRDAVLRAQSGYIVYVVTERAGALVAESRPVVTGSGNEGRVVIREGVTAGDQVVVVGQHQVAAGDRVRITAKREVGS